jgi:hypothetical protein
MESIFKALSSCFPGCAFPEQNPVGYSEPESADSFRVGDLVPQRSPAIRPTMVTQNPAISFRLGAGCSRYSGIEHFLSSTRLMQRST